MTNIIFPEQLQRLLEGSKLQAPIRLFADKVGAILGDNKLPFFPNYTDHGTEHINRVLAKAEMLIPKEVWEGFLLCDRDAVVLIGAVLLHDIGMHLREPGFCQLVAKNSRFKPLPWFEEDHTERPADRPWNELWEDYQREARRFSQQYLASIIGEKSASEWHFNKLPEDPSLWDDNYKLVIGEFLRRHHARLAHEIAIYGFPGLDAGEGVDAFPALGQTDHQLQDLAELIGATARSHGMGLRVCLGYLSSEHHNSLKPSNVVAIYHMALLRVADYFQIEAQRAPTVLLQLRDPQSPVSVQEWRKHKAVRCIEDTGDPRAKMVKISEKISLPIYLPLRELIEGLQREIDLSTAVLGDVYGAYTDNGLHKLNLAVRRVTSNLREPAFLKKLPYVPEHTGFTADPRLLTLLVEPLYGKQPGVGVRELMQNSVDAVLELEAWCETHGQSSGDIDLPDLGTADVLIEFIKQSDESWVLRVQDRGIGMTANTLQHYFLRAGASFRRSEEWQKEFVGSDGRPKVARAGRFGIGAFAIFLLGRSFKLWTRHVGAKESEGCFLEASQDSQLIEIKRPREDKFKVGTTIEVPIKADVAEAFGLEEGEEKKFHELDGKTDWFCWDFPTVVRRVNTMGQTFEMKQGWTKPIRITDRPPQWSTICSGKVFWSVSAADVSDYDYVPLSCNGLSICVSKDEAPNQYPFAWPLREIGMDRPSVAVVDKDGNLPLTVQRYALSSEVLTFENELVIDVIFSFLAHSLVHGPDALDEVFAYEKIHPLRLAVDEELDENYFRLGANLWFATSAGFGPCDPWLYSVVESTRCYLSGSLWCHPAWSESQLCTARIILPKMASFTDHSAVLQWQTEPSSELGDGDFVLRPSLQPAEVLALLVNNGVPALGHDLTASAVLVSASERLDFKWNSVAQASFKNRQEFSIWDKVERKAKYPLFFAGKDLSRPPIWMQEALEDIEAAFGVYEPSDKTRYKPRVPNIFFIAELTTKHIERSPESRIAKIWNECLGPNLIPFDPAARQRLIEKGLQHPELKRHIEAWRKMNADGTTRE